MNYLPSLRALLGELGEHDVLLGVFLLVFLPARLHEERVGGHTAPWPGVGLCTRHSTFRGKRCLRSYLLVLLQNLGGQNETTMVIIPLVGRIPRLI